MQTTINLAAASWRNYTPALQDIVDTLNADTEDNWTYKLVRIENGDLYAIECIDEDGFTVGYLI